MIFEIEIEERLVKKVFVKADNERDAEEIAREIYNEEKVVLTPDDCAEVSFFTVGVKSEEEV